MSDQAEFCPQCGVKRPVLQRQASDSSYIDPGNNVRSYSNTIFSSGDVIITSTLAKFGSQTFPINGIGSVTLVRPKRTRLLIFGCFFLVISLGGFESGSNGYEGATAFLILSLILFAIAGSKKASLWIKTASGDVQAMEHQNKGVLETIKNAIEEAATVRG